jgi:hypothetical protein
VGTLSALTTSGTTSLATTAGALSVGNVAYTWPGGQGAASTVLTNNGSGALTWAAPSAGAAAAGTLTGATLASNVLASSLTSVGTLSALTVGGTMTIQQALEKVTIVSGSQIGAGTLVYDCLTQGVLYYTLNTLGNFTLNFRGNSGTTLASVLAVGQSITVTLLITNTASGFYNLGAQIDGVAQTVRWQNRVTPTSGTSNAIDAYTYTLIKTAATPTYTVLANVTGYGT